jgi:hypothetical protein
MTKALATGQPADRAGGARTGPGQPVARSGQPVAAIPRFLPLNIGVSGFNFPLNQSIDARFSFLLLLIIIVIIIILLVYVSVKYHYYCYF